MAMLFSTPDFNALQILIKSGRFYMQEPLIFHLCYSYESSLPALCCQFAGNGPINRQSQLHWSRVSFFSESFSIRRFRGITRRCFYWFGVEKHWWIMNEHHLEREANCFRINCTWGFYSLKPVLNPRASCYKIEYHWDRILPSQQLELRVEPTFLYKCSECKMR